MSIAANEARQALRRRSRPVVMPSELSDESRGSDPIDSMGSTRAMAGLKSEERALIGLRYVAGFSAPPERAEALGLSAEGVRSRLKRILDRLRRELGQ